MACLALSACGSRPNVAIVECQQKYTPCARPSAPVLESLDATKHVGHPDNAAVLMRNTSNLVAYVQGQDKTLRCYEDQANATVAPLK